MDNLPLLLIVGLLLAQTGSEYAAMIYTKTLFRKHVREWTYYAVAIPFKAMMAASIGERIASHASYSLPALVIGSVLAIAGILVRVRGHLELSGAFSPYVEKTSDQKLVQSGMYSTVRHPMYAGSMLLFVGMPLAAAACWAWAFSVLGVLGILIRMRNEEDYLAAELAGYAEYCQRTWRLLPYVF